MSSRTALGGKTSRGSKTSRGGKTSLGGKASRGGKTSRRASQKIWIGFSPFAHPAPDIERKLDKRGPIIRRAGVSSPGLRRRRIGGTRGVSLTKIHLAPITIARTAPRSLVNSVRYPIFSPAPHKSRVRLVLWGFCAARIMACPNQTTPDAERSKRLFR
jgi:hypothetical protein